jgi:GT2 family glycosyltransferase
MKQTVIIPTWRRSETLRGTLRRLQTYDPAPDEIIVHVDAGDQETQTMLQSEFPEVRILCSEQTMGPGGGRNKLVEAASHEWIVSLDDDSWPMQSNFFSETVNVAEATDSEMIACRIIEKGDRHRPLNRCPPPRSWGAVVLFDETHS